MNRRNFFKTILASSVVVSTSVLATKIPLPPPDIRKSKKKKKRKIRTKIA